MCVLAHGVCMVCVCVCERRVTSDVSDFPYSDGAEWEFAHDCRDDA